MSQRNLWVGPVGDYEALTVTPTAFSGQLNWAKYCFSLQNPGGLFGQDFDSSKLSILVNLQASD